MQANTTETQQEREAREDREEMERRMSLPVCPNCKERPAQYHGWCDTCREG